MAATTRRISKKNRGRPRQRRRTQPRRRRLRGGKTTGRRARRSHRKKCSARRNSKRTQKLPLDGVRMTNEAQNILHFCVHDLYKKVSLAAERLRKKKQHVSITVSDVRNALKKILPNKYNRKAVSSVSGKCR